MRFDIELEPCWSWVRVSSSCPASPFVNRALGHMGLTIDEVDRATCYLTRQGMLQLGPCGWAADWMETLGGRPLLVESTALSSWLGHFPLGWMNPHRNRAVYGPRGGWPWDSMPFDLGDFDSMDSYVLPPAYRLKAVERLLKAFIIRRGRPGAP